MIVADFPATFSQFKEGSRPINEAKAPEWLDVKVKTLSLTYQMMINQKWQKLAITGARNKRPK